MVGNLATDAFGQIIRFMQIITVPALGIITLVGFLFYFTSFKNPIRKRKAFLFSFFGLIGFFAFIYGPLLIIYYRFEQPALSVGNETFASVVDIAVPWGGIVFYIIKIIAEPLLFFLFYFGIAIWLMAAKNPPRKRIGIGLVFGCPVMWVLIQNVGNIYNFFTGVS
ncbi:hypothetical protein [Peribacillus loiseleuriae]|uniref:hypothetical protein n=1 Tax=Peribacillus loiseleuriae TaxID=1679170 RepID=UPI003D082BB7